MVSRKRCWDNHGNHEAIFWDEYQNAEEGWLFRQKFQIVFNLILLKEKQNTYLLDEYKSRLLMLGRRHGGNSSQEKLLHIHYKGTSMLSYMAYKNAILTTTETLNIGNLLWPYHNLLKTMFVKL